MKFDVLHGIDKLVPAAKLVIRGEQIYENVEWLDERPMPTKEEVEAASAKQEKLKQEEAMEIPEIIKHLYEQKFGNLDNFELNITKLKERGFTYEEIYHRLEGKK